MRPGLTTLVTTRPDGSSPRHLSALAHVSPARYSYTIPGGCQDLYATVWKPPRWRTDALNPGRIVEAHRGGGIVWAGILDEPTPAEDRWELAAHGAGALGNDYRALWTGTWGTGTLAQVISNAIAAGLPWKAPASYPTGQMWTGQAVDSASQTVTDMLNLVCNKGGLTWAVTTSGGVHSLSVFTLPTVANRLLVAGGPAPRTVAAGATMLRIRYQSTLDGNAPSSWGLTSVTDTAREADQGHTEDYLDLSSAGLSTAGAAQGVGNQVLKRFTRAAWTESFAARPGALLNTGGVAVDPGAYFSDGIGAMVCKVLLADLGYSGDIARGPQTFCVGEYEWDDAACVASITPFESMRHRFSDLLSVAAEDAADPRSRATGKRKKGR